MKKTKTTNFSSNYSLPETYLSTPNSSIQKEDSSYWLVLILAIILIIASTYAWAYYETSFLETMSAATTTCIASNSTLYTTEYCAYCQRQKQLFGDNVNLLNIIDCNRNEDECIAAEIKVTPTWVIDGKLYSGLRYEQELKELAGC